MNFCSSNLQNSKWHDGSFFGSCLGLFFVDTHTSYKKFAPTKPFCASFRASLLVPRPATLAPHLKLSDHHSLAMWVAG